MPLDPPDELPTAGPVAGKYELVRLIGRGGMGAVWEGRHATLGTRVAIKFIDTEYAESPEARTRFDNEARAAATIQSKHAIQIYDHGVSDDGKPYIVMELLQGEPLDRRLERMKRLPLAETARILRQVARALARAHERGIVHRDLKPENIFLVRTPDDDEEIAKVLDFGIAKFKKVDGQTVSGGISSSTKTGAVIGTPFFMSPEQARGLREIDHRSDLWSLGVIAFKCVTGVLPFEGVSIGDLLVKICTTPAPVPSSVVPTLSPSFDSWFLRALEKEPAKRFQTALDLADALAYSAGLSVKRPMSSLPPTDAHAATVPSGRGISGGPSSGGSVAQSANATSAPLTASTPRATTSSRSVVFAAVSATLVGAAIGAFGIMRMSKPPVAPAASHVTTAATATAAEETGPSPSPSSLATPPSTGSSALQDPPAFGDGGLAELRGGPTKPGHRHGKPGAAPSAAPSGAPAPAPSGSASLTPSPAPSATPAGAAPPTPTPPTSTPPAPSAPAPAPTPKPAPSSNIDPGY